METRSFFALALLMLAAVHSATAACPFAKPCNCAPAQGFAAFNRTCTTQPPHVAAEACAAALVRAGVNITALEKSRKSRGYEEHCRRGIASCIDVNVTLAEGGNKTVLFCTGELRDAGELSFVLLMVGVFVGCPCFICICICVLLACGNAELGRVDLADRAAAYAEYRRWLFY